MYENQNTLQLSKNNGYCHVGLYVTFNKSLHNPETVMNKPYETMSVPSGENMCERMEIDDESTDYSNCTSYETSANGPFSAHYFNVQEEDAECEPYMLDLLEDSRLPHPASIDSRMMNNSSQQQQQHSGNTSSIQGLNNSLQQLQL
ncbi:hypothetical protein ACO0QE_001604 [Hanseniaspora vineae]